MRSLFSCAGRIYGSSVLRQTNWQLRYVAISATRWSQAHPIGQPGQEAPRIKLRYYQEECIQAVLAHLKDGHKRLGVSLATGAGKTVIFTQLIDRISPPNPNATKTLILVHRRELVEQAARHCIDAYPHKTIDIEMGSLHSSGVADITIASVQSICSKDRITKFSPSRYKLVLVDEAHHIVAKQYLQVLEHFGLHQRPIDSSQHIPALVGVSATFARFDGRELGTAIDYIVYHKDYIDMIDEKWLSNVIFTTVHSNADISRVASGANGDFVTSALSKAINTPTTNLITVNTWKERAERRKSTLVFCVDVKHITDLQNTFIQQGIDARYVTGDTPKVKRSDILDAFKGGEFPVLLNCGVFTEGTDIPNIDCVLLARPTKSRNLLVQMIGRGMRLHPGKENCHVIDMVTSLEEGVVTTPTLFGLNPTAIVEDATADDMIIRREKEQDQSRSPRGNREFVGKLKFVEHGSIKELIGDKSEERRIRSISRYTWVRVGDDRYILQNRDSSYLSLGKDETGKYIVKYTQKLPPGSKSASPYMKPRKIAAGETFEHTVHAADTFASNTFERFIIDKFARWRNNPASQAQIDILNRSRPEDQKFSVDTITKGRAMDMLVKFKHGAKAWYDQRLSHQKMIEKANAKQEKERKRKLLERVAVGPVKRASDN